MELLIDGQIALIDAEDLERVSALNWHIQKNGNRTYARTCFQNKIVLLHRFILCVTDSKIWVDHKNHNGLDCRKINIRECTPTQNAGNKRGRGESKFLGVKSKTIKRPNITYQYWAAEIWISGKSNHLGTFPFTAEGEIMAAKKYNEAAIKHYGEFAAKLNI